MCVCVCVNVGSAKWISAYALIALKVCVAMAQFLDGDAVSHCALVRETITR